MKLPNIRKLFVPDLDHVILDCDLSGADAQVVAWEANDADLKAAFRSGVKIHIKNFEDLFQRKFDPEKDKTVVPKGHIYPPYDSMKRAVHGTNYGASARTIAITLGWSVATAEEFQRKWFALHPGIKEWHRRTESDLLRTRQVSNRFKYRRFYFDRMDNLLSQALAWVPQSTVAIVCSKGGVTLRKARLENRLPPSFKFLLQVHDSLVFQVHKKDLTPETLTNIRKNLLVTVPYDDPLTIDWEVSASALSWGDVRSIKWDGSNLGEIVNGGIKTS